MDSGFAGAPTPVYRDDSITGSLMGFDRLLASDRGRIILVNLHHTIASAILPSPLARECLVRLRDQLRMLGPVPTDSDILAAFRAALFRPAARFQVRSTERPDVDVSICAVVGFEKISALLWKVAQRDGSFEARVGVVTDPAAPRATVAMAASLLNRATRYMPDLTLSDSDTIFWATPEREFDRLIADWGAARTTAPGGGNPAGYVRDKLGLVHLDAVAPNTARHLFAMRGTMRLSDIGRSVRFQCARPSTLDGFDNPRFRQSLPATPAHPGCGLTVDLHLGSFGIGAAELVSTPLSLAFFQCEYIGELLTPPDGSDADYVAVLSPASEHSRMAGDLDRMAA